MAGKTVPRLVLGSSSPRRLELLKQIGVTPDHIAAADINEDPHKGELPEPYCVRVAREKGEKLTAQFPDDFILTGDTTVAVGRRIIGKPTDRAEAKKFIELLSGRSHKVHTSVVIHVPGKKPVHRLVSSRVKVKRMTADEIEAYLNAQDWEGFAGAYRIQGLFARYIQSIQGSPSGIIGLPLYETMQMLRGLGYGTET